MANMPTCMNTVEQYEWDTEGVGEFDQVNHPKHYTHGSIETIDYLEGLPDLDFRAANVIKYVSRYKLKNGVEDLKKAKWYLERLIDEYSD